MQVIYYYNYSFSKKKTDGIIETFKKGKVEGLRFFFNKPPKWNESV